VRAAFVLLGENRLLPERLLSLVTECLQAHRSGDWNRLRELVHPEGRLGVFAAGGKPAEVETAIAAMQEAHADVSYAADVERTRTVDGHAVILEGFVSYRSDGRFVTEEYAWLYVFRDGLLYRSEMFRSPDAALSAYRERGPTLGVD
jgi:ketosteroid isomerase-like protein